MVVDRCRPCWYTATLLESGASEPIETRGAPDVEAQGLR